MEPFVSLSAASLPTNGTAQDLQEVLTHHSLIASATDVSGTAYQELYGYVSLQVSYDNSVWVTVGTINVLEPVVGGLSAVFPARYVRAVCSGDDGVAATVTASIASSVA